MASKERKGGKSRAASGKETKGAKRKSKGKRNRGGTGRLGLGMNQSSRLKQNQRVVEEDEFIADVNGSTTFVTTAYPYNPGQAGTFPRFSKEAVLYEKYETESVEFYFKRTVSEFATNGQAGKVILSFDYDAADAPPTTKQMVEDMMPHADGMPCTPVIRLPLDSKGLNGQDSKYVRPAGLPGSTDIRVYDGGNLYITTVGCTNTTAIGELRVRYRIRLMVPILISGAAPANNQVAWFQTTGAGEAITSTVDHTLLLATTSNNGVAAVNTAGSVVLPAGNYLLDLDVEFDANTADILTNATADLKVSGTSILSGGTQQLTFTTANAWTYLSGHISGFFASNGVAPLTCVVNATFGAGVCNAYGSLRVVAI